MNCQYAEVEKWKVMKNRTLQCTGHSEQNEKKNKENYFGNPKKNTSSGSSIITILGSSDFLWFRVGLLLILDWETTGGGVLSVDRVEVVVVWLESDSWRDSDAIVVWLASTIRGQV